MRIKVSSVAVGLIGLMLMAACGSSPPPPAPPPAPPPVATQPPPPAPALTTPDAPFRQHAPPPDGNVTFVAPKVQEARLKNGLRVLIVERHELPIISARLYITMGAGDVPEATPGEISFLGAMLDQGTKKRDALKISDDFEAIGAEHSSWGDWDSSGVAAHFLAERLDAALELMSDVALNSTFPDAEIERFRNRRISAIQAEKSNPGAMMNNASAAVIFGRAHPYGHTMTGEEADAKKVTRAHLVSLYERMFVPQNAALVVVGDVKQADLLPKLESAFGGWKAKGAILTKKTPAAPAAPSTKAKLVFIDRAGAQSQVRLVRTGVPRNIKDREAYEIANMILGGMFSSRVNLNLREKNAYTYGAFSAFGMRHGAGPFIVGAPVVAEKTGPAIQEIWNELDGLKKDGPTDEELNMAKDGEKLALPGFFESSSDVASSIGALAIYNLPLDDFDHRVARIEAVTAADVKRVANEYFSKEKLTVLVVGGKDKVMPQLEPLKLGAPEERDAFGNPLTKK